MYGRIGVELVHEPQQLLFRGVLREYDRSRVYAQLLAALGLVAHVLLGCRVLSHQDHRQPRGYSLSLELGDLLPQLLLDLLSDLWTVDDCGDHVRDRPGVAVNSDLTLFLARILLLTYAPCDCADGTYSDHRPYVERHHREIRKQRNLEHYLGVECGDRLISLTLFKDHDALC
ncbi:MAG: hypothetical protein A4E31_01113 [Methanomassiliicoccales archaeon PtaU1.Bin030]|nr:MAG: hypothetical protein A4E31_01113 [Methanomassiliicoccales archaeon PtaU1.Bin030]